MMLGGNGSENKRLERKRAELGEQNPYVLLELGASKDSDSDIRANYKRLLREFHPDKWSQAKDVEKANAHRVTQGITQAYDELYQNPQRVAQWRNWSRGPEATPAAPQRNATAQANAARQRNPPPQTNVPRGQSPPRQQTAYSREQLNAILQKGTTYENFGNNPALPPDQRVRYYKEALNCYLNAAQHGEMRGYTYAAMLMLSQKHVSNSYNMTDVVNWLQKAADANHMRAQLHLGKFILENPELAASLSGSAQFSLSPTSGAKWLKKAMESTDPTIQVPAKDCLGNYYFGSALLNKDVGNQKMAYEQFKQAAAYGHPSAQISAEILLIQGHIQDPSRTPQQAFDYLSEMAGAGEKKARSDLAKCLVLNQVHDSVEIKIDPKLISYVKELSANNSALKSKCDQWLSKNQSQISKHEFLFEQAYHGGNAEQMEYLKFICSEEGLALNEKEMDQSYAKNVEHWIGSLRENPQYRAEAEAVIDNVFKMGVEFEKQAASPNQQADTYPSHMAMSCYYRAMQAGHVRAHTYAAVLALNNEELYDYYGAENVYSWLSSAADHDHLRAQYCLAIFLLDDPKSEQIQIAPEDRQKREPEALLQKVMETPDAGGLGTQAQKRLANLYTQKGLACQKEGKIDQAFDYYTKAAYLGNTQAKGQASKLFFNGIIQTPMRPSNNQMFTWLLEAARANEAGARSNLTTFLAISRLARTIDHNLQYQKDVTQWMQELAQSSETVPVCKSGAKAWLAKQEKSPTPATARQPQFGNRSPRG